MHHCCHASLLMHSLAIVFIHETGCSFTCILKKLGDPFSDKHRQTPRKARTARLRKDDADAGLQRLGRGRNAGAQAAATDRHEDGVQLAHLPARPKPLCTVLHLPH